MTTEPHMRQFVSHLPRDLWDEYEAWSSQRGKIQNRQLMAALFRLFLAVPDRVKLLALYGLSKELEAELPVNGDEPAEKTSSASLSGARSR